MFYTVSYTLNKINLFSLINKLKDQIKSYHSIFSFTYLWTRCISTCFKKTKHFPAFLHAAVLPSIEPSPLASITAAPITENIAHTKYDLVEQYRNLAFILDSYFQVYQQENKNPSMLCCKYQKECIQLCKKIATQIQRQQTFLELPYQHEGFQLIRLLNNIKSFKEELPNSWYPTVKSHLISIAQATHKYLKMKQTKRSMTQAA